ncbi:hypothetical protein C1645_775188 [Glomus cerebriforme]|uniref:Reverse transcriptase zinc-binding domain-containing protein n=1 Tax=Glomus cerebriforme TaxID=658196 RepID=A0A397SUR6_9GLOM|nr:hypothetical protein C1645_775188 [Glomus cerebriforme]
MKSNILNDLADSLAKDGALLTSPIHINFKHLPNQNATLTWMNLGPLERPARKWATDVFSCKHFKDLINSSNTRHLFELCNNIPIDFSLTKHWLNYNQFSSITSLALSSYISYKIKSLNHLLPICDILQRNLPNVYPKSPIPCPSCNTSLDSNSHIIRCPHYSTHLTNLLISHKTSLIEFLFDKQPTPDYHSKNIITVWINSLSIFHDQNINSPHDNL